MRAHAVLAVSHGDGGDRCTTLRCDPPISLRPTPDGVYLVASAAGPLGGDESRLDVSVGAGAVLTVRSAAASMALPGPRGLPSVAVTAVTVGAGATLRWLPEPTIAVRGCDHSSSVRITLGTRACLVWREEVVLGRSGEEGGSILMELGIDAEGGPVLRHAFGFGPRFGWWSGPAGTAGARAVGCLTVLGPGSGAREVRDPRIPGVRAAVGTLAQIGPGGPGGPGRTGGTGGTGGVILTAVAASPRLLRLALDAALPPAAAVRDH